MSSGMETPAPTQLFSSGGKDASAILANALRIAVTGLVVQQWGIESAQGTRHLLSGWFIFAGSLLLIFLAHRLLRMFLFGRQSQPAHPHEEYA